MKILLQQVNIISSGSAFDGMCKDVLLSDGMILKISDPGKIKESADQTIDGKDKFLCPGFFDLHVNFREPGHEYKEDLISGCHAAMQGGFTGVLCMPSTNPPVHTRSAVEFIINRTDSQLVDVFPSGTLSFNQEGKDLSEMYDMFNAGAKAFTDDKKTVQDASLMLRALLYSRNFGGKIFCFANDRSISANGQMHEGKISTNLGLKGIPPISEEIMISRDLFLAEYTGAAIHFSTISTKRSVELIREAKRKGLEVSCDVSVLNLALSDKDVEHFETNFKVMPPLREKEDIDELIKGLKDGTIDAICSDHLPEDVENKKKEFALAAYGAEGSETAVAAAYTALQTQLTKSQLVEKFSAGPRKILGIPVPVIEENAAANLCLFDFNKEWIAHESDILSKSKNNPFLSKKLQGKALYVFNKNQLYSCS
jgi:dihydroorotase